jgi:hypothetical protein
MKSPELKTIREYFADPIDGGVRERQKVMQRMNNKREIFYREICRIMGRNLRIISPPEPEPEQLELFEAAQGGKP